MDIQDFQEQDFMEILMRLPCCICKRVCLAAYVCVDGREQTRVWTRRYAHTLAGKQIELLICKGVQ